MTNKKPICPFMSGEMIRDCRESDCMAWREYKNGEWDCALIRDGKK